LIAWVSHDLRTPLTSIRAILEALGDGVVDEPETVRRYLQTAQRDIRALSRLIDDLFEISQMDAGGLKLDCQMNALSDLISDTIESFSELARRQQVILSGSADAGVDPVFIDGQRIGQVLANLVSNALRYTPTGGEVSICARRVGDEVEVQVRDSGEGISAEDLPRVFERFYRGDKSRNRSTGGTGLGLAIARGIIDAHGGRIWVESEPSKGTCFTFVVPGKGRD
jgi:signal transduction histidine kinase